MSEPQRCVIVGAGGFAREVAWLLSNLRGGVKYDLTAFLDDFVEEVKAVRGVPVRRWDPVVSDALERPEVAFVAVGDPRIRKELSRRCELAGLRLPTAIDRSARIGDGVEIGEGGVVCAGSTLTVDIRVGAGVQINLHCTIGHDVELGDYVTLSPGVHLSGNVRVEDGVFFGTGAVVINGSTSSPLTIGEGSVIAAGACVTQSVPSNTLVAGVPAVVKKTLGNR